MTSGGEILLVDDDEVFRERLARALRARGYGVVTAGDHGSALATAREVPFDFAVIDLRMPEGSGLVLLDRLRALAPAARYVMLTGYGSIASAVEALRLGAHDYLSKPVDADEVIAALSGEGSRAERAPAAAGDRPVAGPGRVGAHPARAHRLRRQRVGGVPPARHHPPHPAAQAEEVPAPNLAEQGFSSSRSARSGRSGS